MRMLKQSTAKVLRLGPFVDSTDGVTAETGLSIAQADIQISKDGGAFAQTSASSPTTTHDADGWYQIPLTTTDTATLGPITVQVTMSGALPVWEHFTVVPANVYDGLVAGTGVGVRADLQGILTTQIAESTSGRIAANWDEFFDNDNSASSTVVSQVGTATVSGSVQADLVSVKGENLTETTAGRLAQNMSVLFDNGDAASLKLQDDIGTATVSGTINANVTQLLGAALTQDSSSRLATNFSTLFNNGDANSSKIQNDIGTATVTGTVAANVTQVLGSSLAETSPANLADNISQFYDLNTTTTKTVNDVDQASVVGTVNANLVQILSTSITEDTGGNIAANWSEFYNNDDDGASTVTLQTIQDIDDNFNSVAGAGARTITVNVKDTAGTPANLENARVRLTEGVNTFVADTNASGNAVFALDDATYSYAITKAGYTSETGTIVVSADATVNKDIAQSAITPSSGSDTSTGVLICYDENYAPESGVTFSMQMTAGPGVAGDSLDTTIKTATSAATTGLVQFTNLVRGATYQLWRSTFTSTSVFGSVATANAKVTVVVPDAASFDLPEVLGAD